MRAIGFARRLVTGMAAGLLAYAFLTVAGGGRLGRRALRPVRIVHR